MKFDPQKSFGHPVCQSHSDDYVGCDFEVSVGLTNAEGQYDFLLSFDAAIGVPELEKLLESGKATLTLIISCRDTLSRQILEIQSLTGELNLKGDFVRGWIEISPFLISKTSDETLSCDLINPEFGSKTFQLKQGMVLAQAETIGYNINRSVFQRITSVFTFAESHEGVKGRWNYGYEQDNIVITFESEDYKNVVLAQNKRKNQIVLLNAVFLPIVMDLIGKMRNEDIEEGLEDFQWYATILNRLSELDLHLDTHIPDYELAQRVLGMPLGNLIEEAFQSET